MMPQVGDSRISSTSRTMAYAIFDSKESNIVKGRMKKYIMGGTEERRLLMKADIEGANDTEGRARKEFPSVNFRKDCHCEDKKIQIKVNGLLKLLCSQ